MSRFFHPHLKVYSIYVSIITCWGPHARPLIINSVYESLKCWSFGTFFFEVIQLLIRHFHHARNIPRKNSSKHTYKDPLLAWEFSTMAECNSFDSQISYQIIFKWNIRQSQYRIGSLKIIQFSSNVKYVSAIQFLPARTMFCCVDNVRRPPPQDLEARMKWNRNPRNYWECKQNSLILLAHLKNKISQRSYSLIWLVDLFSRLSIHSQQKWVSKNFRQEKSWKLNWDKFIYSIAIFLRNFNV